MEPVDIPSVLSVALAEENNSAINRTASIHSALPDLLFLLGGSAINQSFFDELDRRVDEGGTLEGQSKRDPEEDDLDEASDKQTEFPRPNGDIYFARDWTGRQDVEVLRACRDKMKFVFMYGPPGTGKTALAEAAFGEDLITAVMSGDTEVLDILGQFVPDPTGNSKTGYVWVDGPLLQAMSEGRPFLVDEIGLADVKVLSVLYSAMDGRREVVVTSNPNRGIVKAEDGFFIIAATNPNAPGVNMSEALLSRLDVQVEITTDWTLAVAKLGVPEKIAGIAQSLSKAMKEDQIEWAPQMRELLAFRDLVEIFDEGFAVANLIASAPAEDRDAVQSALHRVYGELALAARI